jgi:3-isopropylmalate dehydrogenase
MTTYKVPVIAGDGIGPEVIAEGRKVVDAAADVYGFDVDWIDMPFGCDHYLKTGETISEDSLKELGKYRAIYLGALGDEHKVKTGIMEQGVLLKMRFYYDQYINLRPVRLLEGVDTPIKNKTAKDIDFIVVRENTEDFYVGIGARSKKGLSTQQLKLMREMYSVKFDLDVLTDSDEIAYQIGVMSREGAKRIIEYSFDLADHRHRHLSSVDKANVLTDIYGLWREVFTETSKKYPDVNTDFNFVDAVTMRFVKNPEFFDVIVTPNMFGDIITDLGAMIQGGLGLAPGGNINPNGTSMFEPMGGSAPKYKGLNKVNPIATIWAGALMIEYLGEKKAGDAIVTAIEKNLRDRKVRTYDLGGASKTSDVGDDVARIVRQQGRI